MKAIIYSCTLALLVLNSACTDRDILESKEGVSLPPVTNLALHQTDEKNVQLSWSVPTDIPESIQRPVSVYIQVHEIISPTRTLSVFNTTLADAPTEFSWEIPDASKTYHFTVKLRGTTETVDVNYASEIYSLGQTVIYEP